MKRTMLVGGSIGAGVILVLAMLSSVVSAQTIKSDEIRTNIIQHFRDVVSKNNSAQDCILAFIIGFLFFLEAFLQGYLFY